jgi:hypothetical protein
MEGIDAEEFFDRYSIEFSVDINDLNSNWNAYFSSENTSPVIMLAWAISAVLLRFAFNFLLPAWPTWICWILAFAIPSVGLYAWTKLTIGSGDSEITIRQLVEAAECGRLKLTPFLVKPEKVVP